MDYTIYLTPSAIADISLSKDYYNSKSDGLGKRMVNEVDLMLNKISAMPYAYSKRYCDIRAVKLSSFPYLIYYKIAEKSKLIQVLRVFNTHQREFWLG